MHGKDKEMMLVVFFMLIIFAVLGLASIWLRYKYD